MKSQCVILLCLYALTRCEEDLILVSKTHSAHLEKYTGYVSAIILHFKIPDDTSFASFKFQAEENALSLFSCKPEDVTVYLKEGAPPVINPDDSKFPEGFLLDNRPKLHLLQFKSNNTYQYINITSPAAGLYFAAAFISYTDPRGQGITQTGLTPDCVTLMNAALYIIHKPTAHVISSDKDLHVLLPQSEHRLYKIFVPEIADSAILSIRDINFCENCTQLSVKIQPLIIPDINNTLHDIQLKKEDYESKTFSLRFMTLENCWYYIDFLFEDAENNSVTANETGQFIFKVKYYSSYVKVVQNKMEIKTEALTESEVLSLPSFKMTENNSVAFKHTVLKNHYSSYLDYDIPYKQYNLIKEGRSESFMYSFDLPPAADGLTPIAINVTNKDIFVLKFDLHSGYDIGGTVQYGLAFKPRIKTVGKVRMLDDEPEGHTIIGCIRNQDKEIPTWPNKCAYKDGLTDARIILNKTSDNNTVYIPFPEKGNWYASFRLFCGGCEKCKCSETCKKMYNTCSKNCETHSENFTSCDLCIEECKHVMISKSECSNCDCDGPCQKSNVTCSSSVVFAISSYPCVNGKCAINGKCLYLVSEGLAYSTCVCMNNYRGWDCSDDSYANSRAAILLELLLLVLSNLMFLPAVYVAFRRKYYVEAIVYFSTCFFSTFYHACDAGERIYSFCLVRLGVLQFSDFFSGLLSIWVTVIAMADLPNPWPSICHIGGAILLAFGTTIDKTSLMVFTVPFITGIVILIVSWYAHYRKTGMRFPSRRYLFVIFPSGFVTVGVGLLMFAFLQTQSNYKYLHSVWHILMAVAIIILLPDKKTFLPPCIESIE